METLDIRASETPYFRAGERLRLTKRAVDAAVATGGNDLFLWDGETKGFGLRVTPRGAKVYVVKYRFGGGRQGRPRWYRIGRHGSPWTLEEARREATRILREVSLGNDPAGERDASRKAPTVSALIDRFLAEHVSRKKQSTAYEYTRILEADLRPALGVLKAAEVTREDVSRLHRAITERGSPYQANRAVAVARKLFNLAEIWGARAEWTNPCRRIELNPERKRTRSLSDSEYRRLGDALRDLEAEGAVLAPAAAAIRLLALSGARLREVLKLEWRAVDFERGALHLADAKSGPRTVFLGDAALDLLRALPREGRYVIAGRTPDAHRADLNDPWRKVQARADLADCTVHGLRHSYASTAADLEYDQHVIGSLLGHRGASATVTGGYTHLSAVRLRRAASRIAAHVAAAMGLSGKPAAEVIPLPARR